MLKPRSHIHNNNGMAIIEVVPVIAVFVLLVNFALGFFGLIHSGILNSIAARNYAFETFRNRSNLNYLRDTVDSDPEVFYSRVGQRYHGIIKESVPGLNWYATTRPIRFTDISGDYEPKGANEHNRIKGIIEGERASERGIEEGVNPAWVRTIYGICLNATCRSSTGGS